VTFQPGWGHYELFGLLSDFRDRIFPCGGTITATNGTLPPRVPCGSGNVPNSSGAYNSDKVGGGVGLNARGTLSQKFDIGVHLMAGDGIGRYGSAGLPDVVARPDGVLVPVRNYQGLGTAEYHSKKLDFYANVGLEYEARVAYISGGKGAGYGSPLFNNSGCYNEPPPSSTTTNVDTPTSSGTTGSGTVPVVGSGGTPLTPDLILQIPRIAAEIPVPSSKGQSGSGTASTTVPKAEFSGDRSTPTSTVTPGEE